MTRDAASFDRLYREQADPWNYETSEYEADKYRRCIGMLPRAYYGHVLDIGCSIGVMSGLIAERCERLLGIDFAPTAVERARGRGIPNAHFEVGRIPDDWPDGRWDLIIFSEVLYYLDECALAHCADRVVESLAPAGECLIVGYRGDTETSLTGEETEDRMLGALTAARSHNRIRNCQDVNWRAALFSSRAG